MPYSKRRMTRELHEQLSRYGKTVSNEAVSLRFMAQNKEISGEIGQTRYAFVVSGKVAPKAVDRNRAKRRGRAILQRLNKRLVSGYLCAFFLKKPAISSSFDDFGSQVESLLGRAGILKP